MLTYQITSALIGFALAGSILYLVRRDHLHGPYAVWWLSVAVVTVILALFPTLINDLGRLTGINYPPTLAMVVGLALVLFKMLKMDIDRSQLERRLRRLTQRLAIMEAEAENKKGESD